VRGCLTISSWNIRPGWVYRSSDSSCSVRCRGRSGSKRDRTGEQRRCCPSRWDRENFFEDRCYGDRRGGYSTTVPGAVPPRSGPPCRVVPYSSTAGVDSSARKLRKYGRKRHQGAQQYPCDRSIYFRSTGGLPGGLCQVGDCE